MAELWWTNTFTLRNRCYSVTSNEVVICFDRNSHGYLSEHQFYSSNYSFWHQILRQKKIGLFLRSTNTKINLWDTLFTWKVRNMDRHRSVEKIQSFSSSLTSGWNCWPSVPSILLQAFEPLNPPFVFHQLLLFKSKLNQIRVNPTFLTKQTFSKVFCSTKLSKITIFGIISANLG